MMKKHLLLLIILPTIFLYSCRKDIETANWEVETLTPLVNTNLSINNIVEDSILNENTDSSLSLVYRNHLYSFTLSDIVAPFNKSISSALTVDSLNLGTRKVNKGISLGELSKKAGLQGALIIASNGSSIAVAPVMGIPPLVFDVNANNFFQTLTLQEGFIDVTFDNGYPVDVTNLAYTFSNKSNGSIILRDTVPLIVAGNTLTRVNQLNSGITIEGDFVVTIDQIETPGTGSTKVLIDTTDLLDIDITIRDLLLQEATAIFPDQDFFDVSNDVPLENDLELTSMQVRSGILRISGVSTIEDSVRFHYEIPSATLNGGPSFTIDRVIEPAPAGGTSSDSWDFDFSGWDFDLTGSDGMQFNTFYDRMSASIDSTGNLVTIASDDSIRLTIEMVDVIGEKGEGYLGQDTLIVTGESTDIDIFSGINSGLIDFEDVIVTFEANNSIGAEAELQIDNVSSVNDNSSTTKNLTWTNLGNPITINRANQIVGPNPTINPYIHNEVINNSNSNIDVLLENMPNKLNYDLTVHTNPNGNTLNYGDFIYFDNGLDISLNIEIPLSIIATNLTLVDTASFDFGNIDKNNQVTGGILKLRADNGFPFNANVDIVLLDKDSVAIDTLITSDVIASAPLNADLRVTQPQRSTLFYVINNNNIGSLRNTYSIVFLVSFNTNISQHVQIYSDYIMDLKLIGDFNYRVKK